MRFGLKLIECKINTNYKRVVFSLILFEDLHYVFASTQVAVILRKGKNRLFVIAHDDNIKLYFNPRTCRGVEQTAPWFFANNSRKTRPIAAKLTVPSRWSIWHILQKFQVDVMSGHQVMTSYVTSCSDEIGRFCDLSHNGARSCFPAYEYAFHWEFIGVYGCLDTIYSWLKVKVTQGHAS